VTIKKQSILLFIFSLTCALLWAQQPVITITDASKITSIDEHISILNHPNVASLDIEAVARLDSLFQINPKKAIRVGNWFSPESWWKITLENQTSEPLLLSVLPSLTDTFEVYKKTEQGWDIERTGKLVAFKGSNLSPPNHVVALKSKVYEKQVFYIHVTTAIPARMKMSIAGQNKINADSQVNSLLNGVILGLVLIISLISLLFYFIYKQSPYLWFSAFLMTMLVVGVYFIGYWQTLLFPNSYWLNFYSPLLINFPVIFTIMLTLKFTKSDIVSPKLAKVSKVKLGILFINFVVGLFYSIGLSILVVYILMLPCVLITLVTSFKSYKKGHKASLYYIGGFIFFGAYLMTYLIEDSGIFPDFKVSSNFFLYALSIQATMLLFALIRHINDFRKDKEKADVQLIHSLETQRQMMTEHNILLEKQVQERTRKLTNTLQELEKKEEELNIYADKLKRSNTELLDFASIISHDLKAPLRNTTSFINLLVKKNKEKFDARDNEFVGFIVKSSNQSVQLVDDLLNYSKLDKNIGEPQYVDLTEIVSNTCITLRDIMEARNVSILLETIPDIQAHRSLIVMLMQNLINNGIKYNDSEAPQIKVGHYKNLKQEDVFYIQDNGIGIAAKYQEEVFKMFRRLHNKEAYEGTGIGLAFCKRIIDYYKGRIWFESTEGAGTTFFFTLPEAPVVQKQRIFQDN
jgi:signal transduction histidine kinase